MSMQIINKPGKYEFVIPYDKEGEEKEWRGRVRAEEKGEYELKVVAIHKATNTKGRVVVKAIARHGAQVKIAGMIKIEKKAQGTDNFLELRVLLLDNESRATADPQLEIEANEVKAGHAASVSKIDEEQILYLMSRGLSRERAEEEIVKGFLIT